MKQQLNFSVLKYRNSFASGEVLNLGILIYDENISEIRFLFPNRLSNIAKLYSNFDSYYIKKVLKSFENKANSFTNDSLIHGYQLYSKKDLDKIIEESFYVKDSSSLSFEDAQSILYIDKKKAIEFLINKYVPHYYSVDENIRVDEQAIKSKFLNSFELKSELSDKKFPLIQDIQVQGLFYQESFNYGWKNGKINLILPLSFDLSSSERIKHKSCQWFAIFKDLSESPQNDLYNFDLLVSKPSRKKLLDDYKKATEFLSKSTPQLRLKDYERIDLYVDEILEEGHE